MVKIINIAQRNNRNELLIIKKNDFTYIVPYAWAISGDGNIDYRLEANQKGYSHGATVGGDKKVKSRTIDIDIIIKAKDQEKHDALINELYRHFSLQNYTLTCGRTDRAYNIAGVQKIKQKYIKSFKQRMSDITFTLLLADPFRYSVQPAEYKYIFSEEVTDFKLQLINNGTVDAPLKIIFTPLISMPQIKILHVETDELLDVRDNLLTTPSTLTVDTKQGTVRRDNFNAINTLKGLFLSIMPGINNYQITCKAGIVRFEYLERWLL